MYLKTLGDASFAIVDGGGEFAGAEVHVARYVFHRQFHQTINDGY